MNIKLKKLLNSKLIKKVAPFVSTHKAEISVGIAIAVGVAAAVELVHATIKSTRLVDSTNCERECSNEERLTRKEIVSLCWRNYILSVIGVTASITGVILGLKFSLNANALLVGAYAAATSELTDIKEAAKRYLPTDVREGLEKEAKEVEKERNFPPQNDPCEVKEWEELLTGIKVRTSYAELLKLRADICYKLTTGYGGYPRPIMLSDVLKKLDGVDVIPDIAYTVGFSLEYSSPDIEFSSRFDEATGTSIPCFKFITNVVCDSSGDYVEFNP